MVRSDLNIMIVEDDPIISTDIKSLLVYEGFNVSGVAKNASKALDILHSNVANFGILDISVRSACFDSAQRCVGIW